MAINELYGPQKVVYGNGSISKVGEICKIYGSKALVVTGRTSAKNNGTLDKVMDSLKETGVEGFWFNDLDSDPVVESVEKGTVAGKEQGVDVIVALGGGSAIDTAKSIGVMMTNEGSIADYEFSAPPKKGIPLVAIPTTAGTGSEATKGAIITDPKRMVKMCIASADMIPKAAILDPELTKDLPHDISAATGMDALTHAIETYIATVSTPMSKPISLQGIKLIAENFEKVMANGKDMKAREGMMLGQYYGGWAISNSATALVHAMSRPLGVYFHVPHGLANAILLARVMKFNRSSIQEELVEMAPALGVETSEKTKEEIGDACIEVINRIYDSTGLPKKLSEVGAEKELLPKLAHDAFVNNSNKINPRVATEEEILNMYYELF